MPSLLKTYYSLTKPGIIYGNVLTAAGGFLLASKEHIDLGLFVATLAGIALVIGSACVFNNYIDRGIDQKMARTKRRALVNHAVSGRAALMYATVLGLGGFAILARFTNFLTVVLGLIAIIVYVVLYGIAKRRSVYGTLVGSIAGSLPVTAGYTAVTGSFDTGAVLLFAVLTLWQMPHFYAIAIFRMEDYRAAGIPVLPIVKGIRAAKTQILAYIIAFTTATTFLTVFGYTGKIFAVVMLLFGLAWFSKGIRNLKTLDDRRWARKMFFFSLFVILTLSVMLSVGARLP